MSIFTVWGLILCLFRCLGPFRVGVFSGYPYINSKDEWISTTGRCIFLCSALMVMSFSILAICKGLTKLQDTTETIDTMNQIFVQIHSEFLPLLSNLNTTGESALPIRDELINILNNDLCPLYPNGNMDLRQRGQQTFSSLTYLDDFLAHEYEEMETTLRQLHHANQEIDSTVEKFYFTKGASTATILIGFFIVPSLLFVSLILGWMETFYDGYFTVTEKAIIPLFCLMTIGSYVACGFLFMATEGNADFCISDMDTKNPQSTILKILERYHLKKGNLYYDSIKFYSHQCTVESPFEFLETYDQSLTMSDSSLTQMRGTIDGGSIADLSQKCGIDYNVILELVTQLQTHTTILSDTVQRILNLLRCESIVPLYTTVIYDSMCESNMNAWQWLFLSSFLITFFSMVMITFRGACYPLCTWDIDGDVNKSKDDIDDTEDDEQRDVVRVGVGNNGRRNDDYDDENDST